MKLFHAISRRSNYVSTIADSASRNKTLSFRCSAQNAFFSQQVSSANINLVIQLLFILKSFKFKQFKLNSIQIFVIFQMSIYWYANYPVTRRWFRVQWSFCWRLESWMPLSALTARSRAWRPTPNAGTDPRAKTAPPRGRTADRSTRANSLNSIARENLKCLIRKWSSSVKVMERGALLFHVAVSSFLNLKKLVEIII